MKYEFKHYRRCPGSTTGVLVGKHQIDGSDVNAAIAAAQKFLDELHTETDFAILRDEHGKYVYRWGADA